MRDEKTGLYYPCFAVGNTAESIANKIQVDEPVIWITDILTQPDVRTGGETTRVTFRVISWERA